MKKKTFVVNMPSEKEILTIIEQHKNHLIEKRKGLVKTPLGIIEGEDYYCHTCKKWLKILTKLEFESKPKHIGKKAVWVERKPEDPNIIAKTYNLSDKAIKLLKLKKEDPERFNILMEMWKEDEFLRELNKLIKKYGFTKEKVIELLECNK